MCIVNVTKVHAVIKNGQCTSNMNPIVIVLTFKYLWSTTDVICINSCHTNHTAKKKN